VELMLSSTGRLPRAAFLGAAAVLLALAIAFEYARTLGVDARWGWPIYAALLFSAACVLSKRLHDRGRAGWWGFLIVWALIEAWPGPASWIRYLAHLVLVVTFADLGFMPGQPGANRFGPNPVESV
jgi:uncharacterized membrane protein YhaH (DUF805 family)